jgi:hypothetical protein
VLRRESTPHNHGGAGANGGDGGAGGDRGLLMGDGGGPGGHGGTGPGANGATGQPSCTSARAHQSEGRNPRAALKEVRQLRPRLFRCLVYGPSGAISLGSSSS